MAKRADGEMSLPRPQPIGPGSRRAIDLTLTMGGANGADPRLDLSALAAVDSVLFLAGDEGSTVRRLRWNARKARFVEDRAFDLADLLQLSQRGGPVEVDIEGLAIEGGRLWVSGSHSAARRKPKDLGDHAGTIARLAEIRCEPTRGLLAVLPLSLDATGAPEPIHPGAARLEIDERGGRLTALLAQDAHIAPFVGLPAKENGLDIEGLAVVEGRVFLGLRGPVLRGWALVLEIAPRLVGAGRLDLAPLPDGTLYRKHFLDLGGLGLRELVRDPEAPHDLLLLAGPTMDLDGPVHLFRWADAARHPAGRLVTAAELREPQIVPWGWGCDHPEGVCLLPPPAGHGAELLVVYDSPDPRRLRKKGRLRVDVLPLRV
jgi:hypothetical protein